MKKKLFSFVLLCLGSSLIYAGTFNINLLSTDEYSSFLTETADIIGPRSYSSAEALGIIGFDITGAYQVTKAGNAFLKAENNSGSSSFIRKDVLLRKGLPYGWDVGVRYSDLSRIDGSVFGFEVRKNILEGGMISPALNIVAGYQKLNGVEAFSASQYFADITLSKGFLNLTPYVGIGWINTDIDPKDHTIHSKASEGSIRKFAGLRGTIFPTISMTLHYEETEKRTYGAGLNFGF